MTTAELEAPAAFVLTTGGVAARLGISQQHLRMAELRGDIPAARRDYGSEDRYYFESALPVLAEFFSSHGRRVPS